MSGTEFNFGENTLPHNGMTDDERSKAVGLTNKLFAYLGYNQTESHFHATQEFLKFADNNGFDSFKKMIEADIDQARRVNISVQDYVDNMAMPSGISRSYLDDIRRTIKFNMLDYIHSTDRADPNTFTSNVDDDLAAAQKLVEDISGSIDGLAERISKVVSQHSQATIHNTLTLSIFFVALDDTHHMLTHFEELLAGDPKHLLDSFSGIKPGASKAKAKMRRVSVPETDRALEILRQEAKDRKRVEKQKKSESVVKPAPSTPRAKIVQDPRGPLEVYVGQADDKIAALNSAIEQAEAIAEDFPSKIEQAKQALVEPEELFPIWVDDLRRAVDVFNELSDESLKKVCETYAISDLVKTHQKPVLSTDSATDHGFNEQLKAKRVVGDLPSRLENIIGDSDGDANLQDLVETLKEKLSVIETKVERLSGLYQDNRKFAEEFGRYSELATAFDHVTAGIKQQMLWIDDAMDIGTEPD